MLLTTFAILGCVAASSQSPVGSTGCGKTHTPGYHTVHSNTGKNLSIKSDGIPRYYTVQVPLEYDAQKKYPLIFDYHGSSNTPLNQRDNSAYYNYTNKYLVVYPEGRGLNWQGPTYAAGSNDLLFTDDLLAHVAAQYCIDPQHIYASGKSNGGGFVDTLACSDVGDKFAAFAMASAALYTDTKLTACPNRKRAILEAHGDKDSIIPYVPTKDGRGGPLPNVGKWVGWWGQRDCGANVKPTIDTKPTGYNVTTYSCNGRQDVVKHYHLAKGGHCWPSSDPETSDNRGGSCKGARVLDFTPKVLEFFGKWNLNNGPGS
ncbi:hypothetical protein LTS10_005631 [Elasticomyces elasticus]|nr:hypothetical protein LTS10_005631 [Elasticomyces elasticus]